MVDVDAIILGAGTNGLTCAAYLAKAGLRVAVLEKQSWIGGGAITQEATLPGFKHDLLATYDEHLLHEGIVKELGLERFGFMEVVPDPVCTTVFPNGKSISLHREVEKTIKGLEIFSAKDARAYRELYEYYFENAELLESIEFSPPPSYGVLTQLLEGSDEGKEFLRNMLLPVGEFLDEQFESPEVKVWLLNSGHVIGSPWQPGSTVPFLKFLGDMQHFGAGYVVGGIAMYPNALRRFVEDKGGVVLTSSPVRKLEVEDSMVTSVTTEDGRSFTGKVVISNVEPKQLFLEMVGEDKLDSGFVKKVKRFKYGIMSFFQVHAALDGAPDYQAGVDAERAEMVHIGPSVEYITECYNDALAGRLPGRIWGSVATPSVWDTSRAPEGKHVWRAAIRVSGRLRSGDWEDAAEGFAEKVLDDLSEYSPNLENCVLKRVIVTPADIERLDSNMVSGDCSVGRFTLDQFMSLRPFAGWSNYRTPIRNLYMCGPFTHPGPGISGACGNNAAKAVLEDLGLSK